MIKIDARVLSPHKRERILQKYDYLCVYCFGTAEEVDHIMPWSYRHDDSEDNLVACCWLCNAIASNKVFESFKAKKEYILNRRNDWNKRHAIPLWIKEELEEMKYNLRKKIEATSLILNNEKERTDVKRRLLAMNLNVTGGFINERKN